MVNQINNEQRYGAMETDHVSNGVSLKDQRNSINQLTSDRRQVTTNNRVRAVKIAVIIGLAFLTVGGYAQSTWSVITVAPNGNMGINTNNPKANLHLHSPKACELIIAQKTEEEVDTNESRIDLNDPIIVPLKSCNTFLMTNNNTTNGFSISQSGTSVTMRQNENAPLKMVTLGGGFTIDAKGDVGFGTDMPFHKIHLTNGNNILLSGSTTRNPSGSPNGSILFGAQATSACPWGIWGIEYDHNASGLNFWKPAICGNGLYGNYFFFLHDNGKIGIGTNTPQRKLDVNGDIAATGAYINGTLKAKKVVVNTTGWSDFVFAPEYKLPTLSETEAYIKANGHLPEIPSAKEVEENGIELGEMQSKLLQKIEELTLHIIELEKRMSELEAKKGGE